MHYRGNGGALVGRSTRGEAATYRVVERERGVGLAEGQGRAQRGRDIYGDMRSSYIECNSESENI